mgnify:CR=1 FL=1
MVGSEGTRQGLWGRLREFSPMAFLRTRSVSRGRSVERENREGVDNIAIP